MIRGIIYGILGACIGCVVGVIVSAFVNATNLTEVYTGTFLGLLIGVGAAIYINRKHVADGPFVTQSQISGLTQLADWKLQQEMVPASLRDKITSWLRSKLGG